MPPENLIALPAAKNLAVLVAVKEHLLPISAKIVAVPTAAENLLDPLIPRKTPTTPRLLLFEFRTAGKWKCELQSHLYALKSWHAIDHPHQPV